jgi:hypothetical protein
MSWRRWILLLLGLVAGPALAHKASDAYLALRVQGEAIEGRWDIALRDLDFALGLDADGDGAITWGELRARHADIAAYAGARLAVQRGAGPCRVDIGTQQVERYGDGAYTVLPLALACPAGGDALAIEYRLFADTDPLHRGLLNLQATSGAAQSAVLDPRAGAAQSFALEGGAWAGFVSYVGQGVWHIWIGFDHILFLVTLLLPAVLVRRTAPPSWQPVAGFRAALWDVFRVVTAFTLAHSITLTLATLGWVSLPSRPVEAVIAGSVVLAALNNVWPLARGRRWWVAFGFGLVHGFGFAGALAELGLPQGALALALLGFNLGVELGQLAIVALFLPLAHALRRTVLYRRWVLVGGSLAIALLAAAWFVERAFDVELLAL